MLLQCCRMMGTLLLKIHLHPLQFLWMHSKFNGCFEFDTSLGTLYRKFHMCTWNFRSQTAYIHDIVNYVCSFNQTTEHILWERKLQKVQHFQKVYGTHRRRFTLTMVFVILLPREDHQHDTISINGFACTDVMAGPCIPLPS